MLLHSKIVTNSINMFDETTQFESKRVVSILTRENHERWFKLLKNWFVDQKLWCVVDLENVSFKNFAKDVFFSKSYDVDLLFLKKKKKQINLIIKANAKAKYQIVLCINDNDEKLIFENKKAKVKWIKLVKKYKKKLKTYDRQYLENLINYKKFANVNIESIWIEIIKLSRKIVEMKLDMKIFKTQKRRF